MGRYYEHNKFLMVENNSTMPILLSFVCMVKLSVSAVEIDLMASGQKKVL